tara:strand:+ start:733 stop:939 length:207 start_codon:yes stop_codon:yes gene_type:complete
MSEQINQLIRLANILEESGHIAFANASVTDKKKLQTFAEVVQTQMKKERLIQLEKEKNTLVEEISKLK